MMENTDSFNEWAQRAALAERNDDYRQAKENWLGAVNIAKNKRNKQWAEARHAYCGTRCAKEELSA